LDSNCFAWLTASINKVNSAGFERSIKGYLILETQKSEWESIGGQKQIKFQNTEQSKLYKLFKILGRLSFLILFGVFIVAGIVIEIIFDDKPMKKGQLQRYLESEIRYDHDPHLWP
jgi:hypothetical protein